MILDEQTFNDEFVDLIRPDYKGLRLEVARKYLDGDDSFKLSLLPSQMGIQNSDYEIFMVIRNQDSDPGFVFAGGPESYEIHTTIGTDMDGIRFIPADSTNGGDDYVDLSVNNMVHEKTVILSARTNAGFDQDLLQK